MLDNNDMEMLKAYFDPKFDAINHRLDSMDERFETIDERFIAMDKRINDLDQKVESRTTLLLDEIGISQNYLEKKFEKLQTQVNELIQYYRITRLEDSNNALLQKRVDNLEDRVTKIEEQMTA